MVKNKALPDSARPCCNPVWSLSLSLPRRLGPIKAGLTCLLTPTPFILMVLPGSCWDWTPAAQGDAGQICIILFRAIAWTFVSKLVRTSASLCGPITSFLKRLGRRLGTGSPWGVVLLRQGRGLETCAFQCRFREKWKILNTLPKIWLTLFYKDPCW